MQSLNKIRSLGGRQAGILLRCRPSKEILILYRTVRIAKVPNLIHYAHMLYLSPEVIFIDFFEVNIKHGLVINKQNNHKTFSRKLAIFIGEGAIKTDFLAVSPRKLTRMLLVANLVNTE